MKRGIPAVALACLLLAAGCQREEAGEEALRLTGKIFVFNYRLAYATYLVTLAQERPQPEGSTVVARFEDPAGGAPLVIERPLFPKLAKVVLESPDISCVKAERPYAVTITVKAPDGRVVQTLQTSVTSTLDQDVLPEKALVVGPAYEKNPDLFRDGKAPERFPTARCAT
ncbi:hypothetical protein [Ensifer soli]|uniref:hypothetical protein n=1 Tax=Ciceribacter sp. sgz301302 TaxID=3342379 RepID=UPI0035BB233D